jgi:hypothetical protein
VPLVHWGGSVQVEVTVQADGEASRWTEHWKETAMKYIVFIGNMDGDKWEQDYFIRDSEEEAIAEASHFSSDGPVYVFKQMMYLERRT